MKYSYIILEYIKREIQLLGIFLNIAYILSMVSQYILHQDLQKFGIKFKKLF